MEPYSVPVQTEMCCSRNETLARVQDFVLKKVNCQIKHFMLIYYGLKWQSLVSDELNILLKILMRLLEILKLFL